MKRKNFATYKNGQKLKSHIKFEEIMNPSKRTIEIILKCNLCKRGLMEATSQQPFRHEKFRKWMCNNCGHIEYEFLEEEWLK